MKEAVLDEVTSELIEMVGHVVRSLPSGAIDPQYDLSIEWFNEMGRLFHQYEDIKADYDRTSANVDMGSEWGN